MGEKQQSFTINFAGERFRDDRLPYQAETTKETQEALEDLSSVRNWSQLRHLCEKQERQRKKGHPW